MARLGLGWRRCPRALRGLRRSRERAFIGRGHPREARGLGSNGGDGFLCDSEVGDDPLPADAWGRGVSGSGAAGRRGSPGSGKARAQGAGPAAVLGLGPRGRAGGSEGLGQKERVPAQKKGKAFFFLFKKGLNQICQHLYKLKFNFLI